MSVSSVKITCGKTEADILVGFGFNCYRFVTESGGERVDVLWSEPGFESGEKRGSGSGIPILFPFPGRIAGTVFTWEGREFPLEAGDGRGNAIHGFVHTRPWRETDRGPAHVTAEFQPSVDDPSLLTQWPSDFWLQATYRVQEGRLQSEFVVENRGQENLPCGLGTHPYFRLPFGQQSFADDCQIKLPVSAQWELTEMNATGQRFDLDDRKKFENGFPFKEAHFDNVFTSLSYQDAEAESEIVDEAAATSVKIRFDDVFRELVVYTPPHREAICIEPYTCVPDAFRLERDGIQDTGGRLLAPGETLTARIEMVVQKASQS